MTAAAAATQAQLAAVPVVMAELVEKVEIKE
jgi:hypothetical protein